MFSALAHARPDRYSAHFAIRLYSVSTQDASKGMTIPKHDKAAAATPEITVQGNKIPVTILLARNVPGKYPNTHVLTTPEPSIAATGTPAAHVIWYRIRFF